MMQANLFKCLRNGFLASCLMLPLALPAIAQSSSTTANSGQTSGTSSMQGTGTNTEQTTGTRNNQTNTRQSTGTGNNQTNTASNSGHQSNTPYGVVPGTTGTGTYSGPYASSTPVEEPTTPANTVYLNDGNSGWDWLGLFGLFGLLGLLPRKFFRRVRDHEPHKHHEPHMGEPLPH